MSCYIWPVSTLYIIRTSTCYVLCMYYMLQIIRIYFNTVFHRIIEWLGLEGTPRITKFQPPCCSQGCQPPHLILDQAAKGPIQPALEHLHGRGCSSLFQHLTTLLVKYFPLICNVNLPSKNTVRHSGVLWKLGQLKENPGEAGSSLLHIFICAVPCCER